MLNPAQLPRSGLVQDPARHARPALPASPLRSFALACTSARKRAGLEAARPRLPQPCLGRPHLRRSLVRAGGWAQVPTSHG